VDSGHIYYVHDGSDTLADNFNIMAKDTDIREHSLPYTMFVHVTPVNNEAPVITANGILRLSVLVCLKHICVITEMEELKYALEGT
jgi:chondroitin sulfate proteoglycan 4